MVQLSHPNMATGKTIALTTWTFVGKVMSLLINMLSRLVIIFLPRSKCLLISWLQSNFNTCLFNFYAEYIMRNTGLDEAQVGIEIAKRNVNNLKYTDLYVYYAYGRKRRRTKEPLDESERGE